MKRIALIGCPNVGKSVIFQCLTGSYVTVSNYPGTTVEVSRGKARISGRACEVIDTPGLYSIYPITEEERVTLGIISSDPPDVLVIVLDAKNLARMLPLVFQLKGTGIPMVVQLNMFDEALARGINIKTELLSKILDLPVVATVAVNNQGTSQLMDALAASLASPRVKEGVSLSPYSDKTMQGWHKKAGEIAGKVIMTKSRTARRHTKLDRILMSPLTGLPILAAIIYILLYQFVGVFGAGTVVDWLEGGFEGYINPWLQGLASAYIPWRPVSDLLVGEYGIFSLGLRYAVAIILPIVSFYFLVFAMLEDSGYLPRLGFLLDRAFKKIGLSGKAIIPIILGFGCVTMATMVTRTLPTRRERLIAMLLLALCVPCAAQTGVIMGLLSVKASVILTWAAVIVSIFAVVGFLLARIMPGKKPTFIIEIPPMRVPQLKNVITKTYARVSWYFKEIVPLFIIASVLIWLGELTGIFDYAVRLLATPLSVMGLPRESASAFIFGFFRRDYGAAGLYDLNRAGFFSSNQLLVAAVVLTLFLPCITQFLITVKEAGVRVGVGISVFILFFSFSVGALLNHGLNVLHITL